MKKRFLEWKSLSSESWLFHPRNEVPCEKMVFLPATLFFARVSSFLNFQAVLEREPVLESEFFFAVSILNVTSRKANMKRVTNYKTYCAAEEFEPSPKTSLDKYLRSCRANQQNPIQSIQFDNVVHGSS